MDTQVIISKEMLLEHWLGHRNLTRKVIEKFPEKELFEFQIGGMRSFSDLVKELLSIAAPGLENIVKNEAAPYSHMESLTTKELLLKQWDEDTPKIISYYNQISDARFHEKFNLFGQYEFPVIENIIYFIDNEIHHRGQGFVYLRALGIEPPFFWER